MHSGLNFWAGYTTAYKTQKRIGLGTYGHQFINNVCAWLDSSIALHWIHGRGEYKLFVAKRVNKIREHETVTWKHAPSKENSADVVSRCRLIGRDNQL